MKVHIVKIFYHLDYNIVFFSTFMVFTIFSATHEQMVLFVIFESCDRLSLSTRMLIAILIWAIFHIFGLTI